MNIKTREQFNRFFKKKTIHLRDSVRLDIRKKHGRLNPLILAKKLIVIHSRKITSVFNVDCDLPSDTYLNMLVDRIYGYRIGDNEVFTSTILQKLKAVHKVRIMEFKRKNCRRSNFQSRILLCHN